MLRSPRNISPAAGPIDTTWLQACHFPLPPPSPKTINPRVFLCPVLQRKKETTEQLFISNSTSILFFFLCASCRPGSRSKNPPVIFVFSEKKKPKTIRRRTVYMYKGKAHLYCADFICTRAEQRWCFDSFSPLHSPSFRHPPSLFSPCFLLGERSSSQRRFMMAHPSLYHRSRKRLNENKNSALIRLENLVPISDCNPPKRWKIKDTGILMGFRGKR